MRISHKTDFCSTPRKPVDSTRRFTAPAHAITTPPARMKARSAKLPKTSGHFCSLAEVSRHCVRLGWSVYVLADQPGVAEAMIKALGLLAPGLRIAGYHDGFPGDAGRAAAIGAINGAEADVVFVSLGARAEACWIRQNADHLDASLIVAAGDSFGAMVRRTFLPANHPARLSPHPLADDEGLAEDRANEHASRPALWRRALFAARRRPGFLRRLIDVAAAVAVLPVVLPAMGVIAAAISLDTRGPVLHREQRIGRAGQVFTVYRFRTMHAGAEGRLSAMRLQLDRDRLALRPRRDPRVTRVGRFLRRTSLDELPELFNVIVGDMSIVGPCAASPDEVAISPDRTLERLTVRPGMALPWWRSDEASSGNPGDRSIHMDLRYSCSRSALAELRKVLGMRGAGWSERGAH